MEHCSFVESVNAGNVPIVEALQEFAPFSSVTLQGDPDRVEHKQTLYPRHAVQHSAGSACHTDLVLKDSDDTIYKGTKANIDSYSAFFDNCKANDTGLTAILEAKGVTDVYCCGLVFDICVKSTALHGAEMGFRVSVIEDACKPLSNANVEATKSELAAGGVAVVSVAEMRRAISKQRDYTLEEYMTYVHKGKPAQQIHNALQPSLSSHAPDGGLSELFGSGPAYTVSDRVFSRYDKDGSGKLDRSEMQSFFRDAFPGMNTTGKIEAMMQAVDTDGDGTVGLNELRAFLRCYNPTKRSLEVRTALIIIDVQNDFISGSLANPYGAQTIVPVINEMRDLFDVVVISNDWHPMEHPSPWRLVIPLNPKLTIAKAKPICASMVPDPEELGLN